MQTNPIICLVLLTNICLLGFPFAALSAQSPAKRVIMVETMPVPVILEHIRSFRQEMKALGYLEGDNLELVHLKAQGDRARAGSLLAEAMKKGKPDAVVTFATLATQAARQILQGTDIPLVFAVVSDPVGAGVIKRVGEGTGNNITGRVFTMLRETKMNMALRMLNSGKQRPGIRFGVVHSNYPAAMGDIKALQELARNHGGVEFVNYQIGYRPLPEGIPAMLADYEKGVRALEGRIDFWWQISGPMGELEEAAKMLLSSTKPVVFGNTIRSVQLGALMTVIPDFEHGGRETAGLVDRILRGADPGSLPVIAPEKFNLGVNLSTALQLGVVIPSDMLSLADSNVYR